MATTQEPAAAQKNGTGELRTDAEPLTERFPVLDAPREVRWMSGTFRFASAGTIDLLDRRGGPPRS